MKWLLYAGLIAVRNICCAQYGDDKIVLINIDVADRKQIARVIDKLNEFNPKVIAIDLQFSSLEDSVSDRYFAVHCKKQGVWSWPASLMIMMEQNQTIQNLHWVLYQCF